MKSEFFLGTYFEREAVLKLVTFIHVFSWIVLGVYACQILLSVSVYILQVVRGYMTGLGFTDYLQNILYMIEQPFRGFVYFVVLQATGKVLLIFLEIENNTRRAARQINPREN